MTATPDDLLSEAQVYERYEHLFVDRELREARQRGEIEFYALRAGIYYTIPDVMAYLNRRRVTACSKINAPLDNERAVPTESSRSANTGSGLSVIPRRTTAIGTMQSREELAARQLESET